ncbi:protein translocase subunit SecD [Paenibacillus sacheonensis]|uniref:Protein translocase subunit SecD n=1 Tax=Paenibacillus sacheonensis TaxID=742054 RepID=A0A7X4YM41_9BACL|nr:protein translocase subunit SecD [Paenibacillus sacheonensis]MBM7563741.1 SecD/SecF fusion protein [Paenibacillus sacheonensis]NBC67904.1 protein translocase subunit SecD [Paenibacillus sacheonensis]
MNRRLLAFVLIVVVTLGVVAGLSKWVVDDVKLGLDLKGGFEILYEAEPIEAGGTVTKESLNETAKSLEARANATGVAEPEITTEGTNRIRAKIAGVTDEAKVRDVLKKPTELTFRSTRGCAADAGYCKVELHGSDFKQNGADVVQTNLNQYEITIKLKDAKQFAEVTREVAKLAPNNQLAIFMDEEQISAPNVEQEINSSDAVINGTFTRDEANDLRDQINLGALPLKLTEKYTQSVGATLGKQSLDETVEAGAIATVVILLFMMIFYRLPGVIASISIIIFIWLLLLGFNLIHATLTLPGIAAFILGIGMAVDANIIMAERIREELRSGKSIMSSQKSGSKHSFRTIIDAHVTTAIAALVLFFIGVGSVKGFAVILLLSIVLSVLTNVFFSRLLLTLLVRSGVVKKKTNFGVKESEVRAL